MMTDRARAQRAIDALRKPDASLARVPNTIRDSIAEVIEDLLGGAATASEPVAYRVRHPTFNHGRWLFLAGRPVSSKDWKDIEPLYSSPQPAKTQKETL